MLAIGKNIADEFKVLAFFVVGEGGWVGWGEDCWGIGGGFGLGDCSHGGGLERGGCRSSRLGFGHGGHGRGIEGHGRDVQLR